MLMKVSPGMEDLLSILFILKNQQAFVGRVRAFFKWNKLLRKAIKRYIKENGKPGIVHVHVPMKAGLIARWIKQKI